jgi:hypothetical protein
MTTNPHPFCDKSLTDITTEIFNVLSPLYEGQTLEELLKKLIGYRYIDEIYQLEKGRYIRWISNKTQTLTNGGIVLDIKFLDTGTHIMCKNNRGQINQILFDESILFQKCSDQEHVLLMANDIVKK